MNLNLARSLKQPFNGNLWFVNILIGAAVLFGAAVVDQFGLIGQILNVVLTAAAAGYCVQVMANETSSGANLAPALPRWNAAPTNTLLNGLAVTIASGLYFLVYTFAMMLLSAVMGVGAVVSASASAMSAAGLGAAGTIFVGVAGITGLALLLFLPMMSAHYAHEGRLSAMIEVKTIMGKIFSRPGNTIVAAIVSALVLGVAAFASLIPFGVYLAGFAAQVVLASLWAQVYRQA